MRICVRVAVWCSALQCVTTLLNWRLDINCAANFSESHHMLTVLQTIMTVLQTAAQLNITILQITAPLTIIMTVLQIAA